VNALGLKRWSEPEKSVIGSYPGGSAVPLRSTRGRSLPPRRSPEGKGVELRGPVAT